MSFCLLCLMLRDLLIPGGLILIADSGHRRPLGVAPLAPKEFKNRFFFFSPESRLWEVALLLVSDTRGGQKSTVMVVFLNRAMVSRSMLRNLN